MTAVESAWARHPGYRVDVLAVPGVARVWCDGLLVAESSRALRVVETDHVERLYFPEADVRAELTAPSDHHTTCPFKGRADYWSVVGADPVVENLFWSYRQPFPQVAALEGHLGVYHERARVEVETRWPGDDRPGEVNRFPVWGDQADLLRLLQAEPAGAGRFIAPGYHERTRNVVEGGQLLGQAVVAAARTVTDQRVTWASMTFARAARFDEPVELTVDVWKKGRTFSSISVRSEQGGALVAPGLVLAGREAPDTIRDRAPMPDVPGPQDCVPYDMGVTGRGVRIVDGAYSPDPDRVGPPVIQAWLRFRDDPGDPALRQALVVQASTHWTIAAAMRPHAGFGERDAHQALSTGILAVNVAFHDVGALDGWLLYDNSATWSGRGLVHGRGTVFGEDARMVASYSVEAMIRPGDPRRDPARAM